MSKKRAPQAPAIQTGQTADARLAETSDAAAFSPVNDLMDDGPKVVSVDAASDGESAHRSKGKKRKHEEKDSAALAADGGKKEKRDRKGRRGKKSKKEKEKAAKAVEAPDQKRETKRNTRGKKHKSTAASELRPLRKVQVLLIENGQPHAHFDGELGVLELVLPKKAEGEDSAL